MTLRRGVQDVIMTLIFKNSLEASPKAMCYYSLGGQTRRVRVWPARVMCYAVPGLCIRTLSSISEGLLHVCLQSNWKNIFFKFTLLSTVFYIKILTERVGGFTRVQYY